jgi:transposase-like protein
LGKCHLHLIVARGEPPSAAERFNCKRQAPSKTNTDKHAGYPPAIERLKAKEALEENCRHRPMQYLNNVLEQDHRPIKRRVRTSQHFRSFWASWRTIARYEAIHMIRKGQACWSAADTKVCLLHRFIVRATGRKSGKFAGLRIGW